MCAFTFLQLVVCCVVVSTQTVDVHVSGVESEYTTLQFNDSGVKTRKFTLTDTITDDKHIKVKGKRISENRLNVGFVAESATILEVPVQPKITVKSEYLCANGNCFKRDPLDQESTYFVHVSGVTDEYDKFICTGDAFTISKYQETGFSYVAVRNDQISESAMKFTSEPLTCEVKFKLYKNIRRHRGCDAMSQRNCFEAKDLSGEGAKQTIALHVADVEQRYIKLELIGHDNTTKTYALGPHETSDNYVHVTENKTIDEKALLVDIYTMTVNLLVDPNAPGIKLSLEKECGSTTNCLKKNPETYKVKISGVGDSQKILKCLDGSDTDVFTLVRTGNSEGKKLLVTDGNINAVNVPIRFAPTSCEIEEVAALSARKIEKLPTCSAESKSCFKSQAGSSGLSFKLSLFTIPLILANIL